MTQRLKDAAKLLAQRGDYEGDARKAKQATKKQLAKIDEEIKKLQAKRAKATERVQALLAKGRDFSLAEQQLVSAFMADPARRAIRQAPKQVRPEIARIGRAIEKLEASARDGKAYLKRMSKVDGILPEELKEIRKHQEGREANLAEVEVERETLEKRLASLEEAHEQVWNAFLAECLAYGEPKPEQAPAA